MDTPSDQQIIDWKKEFKEVFSITAKGQLYYFRSLRVAELEALPLGKDGVGALDVEDLVLGLGILWPTAIEFDSIPAGIASTISEEILTASGFSSPKVAKEFLEGEKAKTDDLFILMKAYIIAAMPAYKEDDFDHLTFRELARKVALAEKVLEVHQASYQSESVTLDLIDPEEELEEEQKKARKHNSMKTDGHASYDDPVARKLHQALSQQMGG